MTLNLQRILLVENDDGQLKVIRAALQRSGIPNPVVHMREGSQALDYVFRHLKLGPWPLPAMVLLGANLEHLGVEDVLATFRASERLRELPVVILISSAEEGRRLATMLSRYGNSYILNRTDFRELALMAAGFGLDCRSRGGPDFIHNGSKSLPTRRDSRGSMSPR